MVSFEEWSQSMDFGRGEAADDARAGARVVYDRLVQSGDYGTEIMGVAPGSSSVVEVDGKKWHRMGVDPAKITEQRFSLAGYDPSQHYMYSPEYGHLIADGFAQNLNTQAQRIAMEDKANNPFYQKFFDSGGGVGLVAGAFMAPVAAAGGMGAGGLAGAEAATAGVAGAAGGAMDMGVGLSEVASAMGADTAAASAALSEGAASTLGNVGATASEGAGSVGGGSGLADPFTAAEIAEPYGAGESFGIRPSVPVPTAQQPQLADPATAPEIPEPYGAGESFGNRGLISSNSPFAAGESMGRQIYQDTLGSAARSFLDFFKSDMAKYGLISQAGGMLAGAFKPSTGDQAREVADERLRLEAEQRAAIQPNFQVGNVRLPTANPQPLRRPDGSLVYGANGLINRNIRRV